MDLNEIENILGQKVESLAFKIVMVYDCFFDPIRSV